MEFNVRLEKRESVKTNRLQPCAQNKTFSQIEIMKMKNAVKKSRLTSIAELMLTQNPNGNKVFVWIPIEPVLTNHGWGPNISASFTARIAS